MELPPDNPSFLTGACGIGLALLAAACEAPPAWDALLLLDQAQAGLTSEVRPSE
jgi:hypothetical protein